MMHYETYFFIENSILLLFVQTIVKMPKPIKLPTAKFVSYSRIQSSVRTPTVLFALDIVFKLNNIYKHLDLKK